MLAGPDSSSNAPGQSVSASGMGAMGVGDAEDLDMFGADVSPLGGTCRQQESGGGGGPEDCGDHLPSSPGGDLVGGGAVRSPVAQAGGTLTQTGHQGPGTPRLQRDLNAGRPGRLARRRAAR